MRPASTSIRLALLLAAACGGQTTAQPESGVPAGLAEAATATPPFAAADVQAAQATCSAPHGHPDPYASSAELGQRLVGAWLHCDPDPALDPHWPAIEFTADGRFYVLVDDGSGGLVRGAGIDSEGTWDIRVYGSQENRLPDGTSDPNASYYLDIYGAQAAGSPQPAFESTPRRLDYEEATSKWFVPLTHP